MALDEATGDGDGRANLLRRLKESATTTTLTLMSIVQGVALADLAGVVAGGYTHFSPTQWLLVFPTFLLLIAAWNQVTIDTLSWVQVPDMLYAVVPFIVGAFELFLNHSLRQNEQAWLIGVAILVALSTLAIRFTNSVAARHAENASLFAYLQPMRKWGQRFNLFGAAVLLLLALVSAVGGFARVDGAVHLPGAANFVSALIVTLFLLDFIRRHALYWQVVVAYAESRPQPHKRLRGA